MKNSVHSLQTKMKFVTFVILDLESTDLHSNRKITELAMVACSRSHCEQSKELPRIMHKLVIGVNPGIKIHPIAGEMTGLDNEILNEVPKFEAGTCELVINFIRRLPKPLCMLAHNGKNFDFPTLARELNIHKNFNNLELYCADTLLGFRALFPRPFKKKFTPNELLNTNEDLMCLEACENSIELKEFETNSIQKENEMTPPHQIPIGLCETPEKSSSTCLSPLEMNKAKRKLKLGELSPESPQQSRMEQIENNDVIRGYPTTYKLKDIYRFLIGCDMGNCHRAEDDTIALLKCILRVAPPFLEWLDENAVPFSNFH